MDEPTYSPSDLPERIASKIRIDEAGCWLWQASLVRGYGQVFWEQRYQRAHRVIYKLLVGLIADGLSLDHLCRVPRCVNPAHLEPVTSKENARRNGLAMRKEYCRNGHQLTDENRYFLRNGLANDCRICKQERERRRVRPPRGGRPGAGQAPLF